MELLQELQWRYATKKMNGQVVPQEKIDYILEAVRLAPSSSGLQPYELLVVTNKELLVKIQAIAHNQSQVGDCSHLLVFAAWDTYTAERINEVFARNNRERGLPDSVTDAYRNMLLENYVPRDTKVNFDHAAKQAYIGLGVALVAAAEQKVDATPMEGFNNVALDELLELSKKGLKSVVIMPIGYRDENNDWLVKMKKIRKPKEELVTVLS